MKYILLYFLLVAFVPAPRRGFTQEASAPVKFHGRVVTLDSTYEGEILVNMFGANPDTIRVEWEKTTETDTSTRKTTYSITNHVNSITMVLIESDTFYFKNLADRPEQVRPNCLVKKVYGTEILGLYQFTSSDGRPNLYVGMFRRDPLNIEETDFTSDKESMVPYLLYFNRCPRLYKKLKAGTEGYAFTKGASTDATVTTWKKVIDEYFLCVGE
ncbi:hypothetical protein V9K67_19570 [Paraflavisolibacter sp. H34]|uniref:hypothetical protein n=1 Tax=Huijunlia imazamoxiresistens TaxID=3127457 RepID=UPI00301B480E